MCAAVVRGSRIGWRWLHASREGACGVRFDVHGPVSRGEELWDGEQLRRLARRDGSQIGGDEGEAVHDDAGVPGGELGREFAGEGARQPRARPRWGRDASGRA